MAFLEAQNISVDFPVGPPWRRRLVHALCGIDLVLERGEIVGVVGESGSGKSTLGNVFVGTQLQTRGELMFEGRPLLTIPLTERAGKFAAVLQHPKWSLNPMLKIFTSVIEPLKVIGKAGNKVEQRKTVENALEQVGLQGDFQDRYSHELSGGQRQRVSIARALITRPGFVLFDEAVSALDVSVQAQVLNLIIELQAQYGFSAIFISHDLAATRYVASRIAVFYAGRLVEDAPSRHFYELATHPYSRGLQFASGLTSDPALELALGSGDFPETGCPLWDRCPMAQDRCQSTRQMLRDIHGAKVACDLESNGASNI